MELHDFALSLRRRLRRFQFTHAYVFKFLHTPANNNKSTDKAFLKFSRSWKIKNEKFRKGNKKYSQLVIFRALWVVEFGTFLHDSDWSRWWLLGSQKSFRVWKFSWNSFREVLKTSKSSKNVIELRILTKKQNLYHVIGSLKHQVIMLWIISELEYLESAPVHTFKVIKFYGTINLTLS